MALKTVVLGAGEEVDYAPDLVVGVVVDILVLVLVLGPWAMGARDDG